MNIQSDAFVVNQCDSFGWDEWDENGHQVRFLCVAERGVGLSRNTALMRAKGDICLFSDEDLVYRDGYEKLLQKAFEEYPKADVIVFNIHSMDNRKKRYQITRAQRIHWFNYMRYGAARIAVRRTRVLHQNISFSLLFGGGAPYSSGEDTLFLHDCLKAGLNIYALPLEVADIDDSSSTWFQGYTEKFLRDRGALHAALFGHGALGFSVVYLLRHPKVWKENGGLLRSYSWIKKGIWKYQNELH